MPVLTWLTPQKVARRLEARSGSIRRWLLVLLWGAVLGFGLVFLPHLRRALAGALTHVDPATKVPDGMLAPGAATLLFWTGWWALVAWLLHGLLGVRWAHFRHWRRHPPLALAGFVAITASLPLKLVRPGYPWSHGFTWWWLGHLFAYTAVLFTPMPLLAWWREQAEGRDTRPASSQTSPLPERTLSAMDAEELTAWLHREDPLTDAADDLFGFARRAPRVLAALRAERPQTVGLTGPFGSGKTSLVNLVERLAKEVPADNGPRLWFAKVNCWGFRDPVAAQEAVLKRVVATVREEVDVWGLRSLPEEYVRSVSSAHKAVDVALAFLRPDPEPTAQLRRLSPVLKAVGARLVVVIEDVDRNDTGFGVSHVQALLYRLREVEGLSFILSARTGAEIDFTKLCDRQEELFPLDRDEVLDVVAKVQTLCLDGYPEDVGTSESVDLLYHNPLFSDEVAYTRWYWFSALPPLLNTPRGLKTALRRTVDAWERLHGEVDFHDLLMCSTLRTVAPAAFDFLRANFTVLRRAGQSTHTNLDKEDLKAATVALSSEWERLCARATFPVEAAARLLRTLVPQAEHILTADTMPGSGGGRGRQLCSEDGPTNYWERLLAEDLRIDEERDQPVLHAIREAAGGGNLEGLAVQLSQSHPFSERFAFLASDWFPATRLLDLCSALYDAIRTKEGRCANDDAAGFVEVGRLAMRHHSAIEPKTRDWLFGQIERSLPRHVTFAADLLRFWMRKEVLNFRGPRRHARTWARRVLRAALQGPAAPSLCDCLDDGDRGLQRLLNLVAPEEAVIGRRPTPARWAWLRPSLVDACHQCPERLLPQLAAVVERPSQPVGGAADFAFDSHRLEALLDAQRDEVLALFAERFPSDDRLRGSYFEPRAAIVAQRARELLGD